MFHKVYADVCHISLEFILGVRLPHSIVLNRLQWQWETFPYSPTESVGVFKTALTFVDSVAEIWGPLLKSKLQQISMECEQCFQIKCFPL